MGIAQTDVEQLFTQQRKRLEDCREEMVSMPEGYLTGYTRDGRIEYTQILGGSKEVIRKGITGNLDLVYRLARKKFLTLEMRVLEENLQALEKTRRKYRTISYSELIEELPRSYQGLDTARIAFGFEGAALDWMNEEYEKDESHSEENVIPTALGFRVKSKVERDIVETIAAEKLPVRYEQVMYIDRKKVAPDFTIRKENGELVYWEHFGRMDLPWYRNNWRWKMERFETVDIYPGKNLILTFEGAGSYLSTDEIRAIINSQLK